MMSVQPIFQRVPLFLRRFTAAGSLGLVLLLALGGCDPHSRIDVPETDEVQYRRGQQSLRQQQNQIALEAFLKVIDKRDGDAPESHLEAGRIYLTHLSDPYAAIYHFRRYLQIRPNSTLSPMVRQMIETAMKESLKGLPGNAMSSEVDRLDLLEMVQKLKNENADLRARLDRAGIATNTPPTLAPTQTTASRATQPADTSRQSVASQAQNRSTVPTPEPPLETLPDEELPLQAPVLVDNTPPPQQAVRQAPQRPGSAGNAATTTGRTYIVQPKDTLSSISRKFYGSNTRWRDIYALNRDRMKSETDLKIGMELRLP